MLASSGYSRSDDMDIGEQFILMFQLLGVTICWLMLGVCVLVAVAFSTTSANQEVSVPLGIVFAYSFFFFFGYIRRIVEMWMLPLVAAILTFAWTLDFHMAGKAILYTFFGFGPGICLLEHVLLFCLGFGMGYQIGHDGKISMGHMGLMMVGTLGIIYAIAKPILGVCVLLFEFIAGCIRGISKLIR